MSVTGLGSNWYIDGTWPSANIATTSTAYDTALTNLQTASGSYLTAKNNLITAMNGGTKAAINSALTSFDSARSLLNTRLGAMQAAYTALTQAATSGRTDIDSKLDQNMSDFAAQLASSLGKGLTSEGTTTSTLGSDFNNADDARIAARSAFFTSLSSFFTAQNNLNAGLVALQAQSDLLLSLQAKLAADSASPAASASTLSADQNNIDAQGIVVNNATATVTSLTATRDTRLTALHTKLDDYQTAIDTEVDLLSQGAQLAQTSAAGLIAELQAAKSGAITNDLAAINAAKAADDTLHNQHLASFPNVDPALATLSAASQAAYLDNLANINSSTLSAPIKFNTQINVPSLPAAGKMSMSQLMQFITLVEVLLDQLIREIRRTDSSVNELRLSLFGTAGKHEGANIADITAWGKKLTAADTAYNNQVALDNTAALANAIGKIDNLSNKTSIINNAISSLNNDINQQNARGIEVVRALNSAIQMAADNYKVQLWADHGQLTDLQNQLQTAATGLATSDPLKAPLQTATTALASVIADLNTISTLLSVRPIDETAIGAAQTQLTTDYASYTAAVALLPTTPASIQSTLTGVSNFVDIVQQDQTALQTTLHNAEVGATSALNAQVMSELSSYTGYSDVIASRISLLDSGDPAIPYLTNYKNALDAVVSALNTLSTDLTTLPVNFATLDTDSTAVAVAVNNCFGPRLALTNSVTNLSDAVLQTISDVSDTDVNISSTRQNLETYIAPTFSDSPATTPPALPGRVKTALMPPPLDIPSLNTISIGSFTPPQSITDFIQFSKYGSPQPIPDSDLAILNDKIDSINQKLAPILPRLHLGGHNSSIQLITPVYIRPFIAVRDFTSTLDSGVLNSFFVLMNQILQTEASKKDSNDNAPTNALFSFADMLGTPNPTAGDASAQGVGAGTGLSGANLASSAGNIGHSLTAILDSTQFQSYVQDIFNKSGVVAGLAALKNVIPNSATTYSQLGIVETKPAGEPTATTGLTEQQKVALATGVKELLTTVEDAPKLKSDLLALLKSLGTQSLSEEEIKQLLALLIFLLQLLALLVSSVAVAAGSGATNIDNIVKTAFEKPEDKGVITIINDLRNLGVKGLPVELAPSSPQFIPTIFNAINNALTPAQQLGFVAQVATIFTNNNVTINTTKPLGNAIKEALTSTTPDVSGQIRQQLTQLAQSAADQLRSDILRDESRRPSITSQIKALNPEGFKAIPQQQVTTVTTLLDKSGPVIPGLSAEDRNSLVLAFLGGIITPDQAKSLVDQFLKEGAIKTNPDVGKLLSQISPAQVTKSPQAATTPITTTSEKPLTTPLTAPTEDELTLTPIVTTRSRSQAQPLTQTPPVTPLTTLPGTPGQLPDTVTLVTNVLKSLSKQTSDSNFLQEVVLRFADTIRDQSDFYQKSLTLILDPANTYVKNFSIMSRQTSGHDGMESVTQIPISG